MYLVFIFGINHLRYFCLFLNFSCISDVFICSPFFFVVVCSVFMVSCIRLYICLFCEIMLIILLMFNFLDLIALICLLYLILFVHSV